MIPLSKVDDAGLNSLISLLPGQCVAIMEDIGAAFAHGITRDISGTDLEDPRIRDLSRRDDNGDPKVDSSDEQDGGRSSGGASRSKLTLPGLLNALDGIFAQEGCILFATTNRYHALDSALTRPVRMDLHVEFRLASRYQTRELYRRFYIPDTSEAEAASTDDDDDSENDDIPSDSGYVMSTKEDLDPTPPVPKSAVRDTLPNYSSTAHSPSAPKLSRKLIEHLAEGFASRIPEREFSMASFQGYLMSYKTHHFQAVDDVDHWIEDTRETQDGGTEAMAVRVQGPGMRVEKITDGAYNNGRPCIFQHITTS
ncbi:P-loop containing nucleoside triphosphate hydrolase protein [Lactarius sanguifluus]|nr:P-loop containing nucleoside triphosphate hydrolase protein [Lactarius sanguifluus]